MWTISKGSKGPATRNDFVNDIVNDARADAILATLKAIVDDIVTCGMAFSELRGNVKTRDEKVNHLQTEIGVMKSTIDEREQYIRRNSLRISGVQEVTNEDIIGVTLKFITNKLGLATPIVEHYIETLAAPSTSARPESRCNVTNTGPVRNVPCSSWFIKKVAYIIW